MSEPTNGLLRAGLQALGETWPLAVDPDPETERALRFLGCDVAGETVVAASRVAGVVAAALTVPLVLLTRPGLAAVAPVVAAAAGVVVAHLARRVPTAVATVRRTRALGEAPGVLVRAVLRMRVEPTAEAAAAFAARTGQGRLAASLRTHVRRARGTPRSGLSSFADEWVTWFPALRRSTGLVVAAADTPPEDRHRTLDRAMRAVLDGTRDRMAAFADEIRGPATALYAFGVLLPLALVAVLPAAGVAGVAVSLTTVVLLYDFLLPAVVVAASGWLLVRRPVAFPPPSVDRSHPDVPDRRWPTLAVGAGVAGLSLVVAPLFLPGWTAPVAAVGFGAGTALIRHYRPVTAVRDRVRAVESDLPDALHLVGRRVAEGEAVETALERAAAELAGETGAVFETAARTGRRLRVDLRESLLGPHGALADVPSPRARGAAALLAVAAEEGEPAGSAVVAMAEHLGELEAVERAARRELAQVTGTLRHTAAVFGPLVGGSTVALAEGLTGGGLSGGVQAGLDPATTPLPVAGLGLAVGTYVLFLAAVLSGLAAGLRRGLDPALLGHRVGWALCSATAVFLVTVRAVGTLL